MKFVSLALFLSVALAQDDDHRKCACEARDRGFSINCGTDQPMRDAVAELISNSCENDCSSVTCLGNFFILQAHHDYCLESEVPESVEDALHIYEDACEHCDILKKVDPGLPSCPAPNCGDGSGTLAYNSLISNNCLGDCTSTACVNDFRTLKAVHDLCEEDALSTEAELGYHDLEEACEDALCNVGDAALEAEQLVCDEPVINPETGCPLGSFEVPGIGCICFSGASTVESVSGNKIALAELQIGDVVMTESGKYEPVYGFAHYAPDTVAEFQQVTTTDNHVLQVSEQHLLRAHNGSYVAAGTLQVGDVLYHGHKVLDIRIMQAKGVFAPYTPSGKIVVDGLDASCYVMPDMELAGGIRFSGQWLAHSFEFPHRVSCHYFKIGRQCHAYNEQGMSVGKVLPLQWFGWLVQGASVWMRTAILAAAVIVFASFNAMEFVIFKQPLLFVALAYGCIMVGARKQKKSVP